MGSMIGIHQQAGVIQAYLTYPEKATTFQGAVIVVHELWGLTDHIKQVSDRIARQGYYVLAPDLYSGRNQNQQLSQEVRQALFSKDEHVRYAIQPKLRVLLAPAQTPQFTSLALSRLASCFEYMYNQPLVHQRVAMVGFGLGGGYTIGMAVREPRLRAAVSFYGQAAYLAPELRHIACPVLALYGGDSRMTRVEAQELERNMARAGTRYTSVTYEDVRLGFFDDTNPFAYDEQAAADAWSRLTVFLRDTVNRSLPGSASLG